MNRFILEIFFDPATEQSIRAIWGRINTLLGEKPPARGDARPHLSAASTPTLNIPAFTHDLKMLAARVPPLPLEFSSVATFPTQERVLFLSPVVTTELLALQEELYHLLRRHGGEAPWFYAPTRWTPHCTLCHGIPATDLFAALDIALSTEWPMIGHIEQIALVDVESVETTDYISLSGGSAEQQ